jgi:hypothetical protein
MLPRELKPRLRSWPRTSAAARVTDGRRYRSHEKPTGVDNQFRISDRDGFSGRTTIDRPDFGLTWNQALEKGGVLVGTGVTISLQIQATS